MTLEEAEKVLWIMGTADGGCPFCSLELASKLAEAFPELEVIIDDQKVDQDSNSGSSPQAFSKVQVRAKP